MVSGRINYNAPTEKRTTHGEGSDQIPRTVGNSRPRHTGVAEAAGALRLGPTVYKVRSFLLKDSSVTSVTIQMAFLRGGRNPPRRLGDGGAGIRSGPRGRNSVPRRNEPSRSDCWSLAPSSTGIHRAGSTTTQRPRKVPRMAREATKYNAPKEITVRATREPRRRPGIFGWDSRSISYALSSKIAQSPQ
jgi:hypothetical protein